MGAWKKLKTKALFPAFFHINENVMFPFTIYIALCIIDCIHILALFVALTKPELLESIFTKIDIKRCALFYIPLSYNYLIGLTVLLTVIIMLYIFIIVLISLGNSVDRKAIIKKLLIPLFCFWYVIVQKPAMGVIYKILLDAFTLPKSNVIAFKIIATIFTVVHTIIMLALDVCFSDNTIQSKLPWSGNSAFQSILRCIIKLYAVIVIYTIKGSRTVHCCIITILAIIASAHILLFHTYNKQPIKLLETLINFGVMWMGICLCLNTIFDKIVIYNILILIFFPFSGACGILGRILYEEKLVYKLAKFEKLDGREFEVALSTLTQEISMLVTNDKHNRDFLNSMVIFHCIKCKIPQCYGFKLIEKFEEKEDITYQHYGNFINKLMINRKKMFIKYKGLTKLRIGEVMMTFLHLKMASLVYLMLAARTLKGYAQEFRIYTLRRKVLSQVHDELSKADDSNSSNISQMLFFHQKYLNFQECLKKCTEEICKFWKDVITKITNISKLSERSALISKYIEEGNNLFEFIKQTSPNFVKSYVLFSLFYKEVLLDKENSKYMKRSAKSLLASFSRREGSNKLENEFGINTDAVLIRISLKKQTFGTILSCNNEIESLLGFSTVSLIGKSINMLMPDILAEYHDKFIKKVFNTQDTDLQETKILTFALHSDGCIVPIKLIAKSLPNIKGEVEISGFINSTKYIENISTSLEALSSNEAVIFLLDSRFIICGLHRSLGIFCKAPEKTLKYNKYRCALSLQLLFPDIFSDANIVKMQENDGFDCNINIGNMIEMIFSDIRETSDQDTVLANDRTYRSISQTLPSNIKLHKFEYTSKHCQQMLYCVQISFTSNTSVGELSDAQKETIDKRLEKVHISKSDIMSQSSLSMDPNERMLHELRTVSKSSNTPQSISKTIKIFSSMNLILFVLTGI